MSSIKDFRWDCSECGVNQGRNDMWHENDVCGDCNAKKLTEDEKKFLETFCYDESRKIKREHWLHVVSGGFCNVDFESCDKNEIRLSVAFGSVESTTHHDTIVLDRDTLTYID